MDKVVLLAEIRATIASTPDFAAYTPTSRLHLEWLARADALLTRWDGFRQIIFRTAMIQLVERTTRSYHLGTILTELHRAEADLALDLPVSPKQVFGPGAVYDFLKALRELLASATSTLLVIDPYLDEQIFDVYLSTVSPQVAVRLLTRECGRALKASLQKFVAQGSSDVSVRVARDLHDRVVFVDSASCWVLGQSIKDAAKKAPTYIAPLPADAGQLKRAAYDAIWESATPLCPDRPDGT